MKASAMIWNIKRILNVESFWPQIQHTALTDQDLLFQALHAAISDADLKKEE